MHETFNLFTFTIIYYQIENFLKPCVLNNLLPLNKTSPVTLFYQNIQTINIFIFCLFVIFTSHLIFFSKVKNSTIYSLSYIYMKYTIDNITTHNTITLYHYEMRRTIMWLFTTPLILKIYCEINKLNLMEINAYYHIVSNIIHILLYPYRDNRSISLFIILLGFTEMMFIYKLCQYKQKKYTMFIVYIWSLFSFLNIIELTYIFKTEDIQLCYLISDLIAKFTIILIVYDCQHQNYYIRNNVDLQGISLLTSMQKTIKQFQETCNITPKCKFMIQELENKISNFIPTNKTTLKLELLKKILPLELEEKYLTQTKDYKHYDFICVLFTDIVSYTEMAKKYEPDIIYKLLNNIYTCFDDIIKRYNNLQKIETIGDAYMVVSDIYTNDQKNNVKNMLLFAFDLLHEIKHISTPDGKPLELRIGMNLGKVVVGILGIEIPRLCVIGNTVNVANRLQTTTEPNTIQVSTHVHEIIEETEFETKFHIEKKENVFLKNLGSRTTYIITQPI